MADPVDPRVRQKINALAATIDEFINGAKKPGEPYEPKHGFAILIFDFDKPEKGRMNWISNAQREDMIVALKEMAAQLEGRIAPGGKA
ncbi:hypothetical protein [Brucella intermedia]|uniref:Uncharacterized protein n=1 Tax=Brucella intermedia M86 TaxID=1234597 RepID=M5JKR8_9HYPH|nr:hypothetical protein [Brucella intermedia]ELT47057.1 hypothetical protein D584_21621 [Brucella intermedia M86]